MIIELLTKRYPGMRLWLAQRLSAVFMAAYLLLLALVVLFKRPQGFAGWHALMSPWWWRVLTLLFFVSLIMHAWLGVRDVFKDYVFNLRLRAVLQVLVDVLLVLYLGWAVMILWSI